MSCGVGCRHDSDPALLWLWRRPATVVLIQPLAWEPPYATGAALKKDKRQNKNKNNKKQYKGATLRLEHNPEIGGAGADGHWTSGGDCSAFLFIH